MCTTRMPEPIQTRDAMIPAQIISLVSTESASNEGVTYAWSRGWAQDGANRGNRGMTTVELPEERLNQA